MRGKISPLPPPPPLSSFLFTQVSGASRACRSDSTLPPPLSKVILMHVNDPQLAFVIARLVEIRDGGGASPAARTPGPLGGLGGMGGFASGGGGGGFGAARGFGGGFHGGPGGGGSGGDEDGVNAAAAHKSIGGASRKLLRDEFLPIFDGESDVPKGRNR